jgi:chemotaxis protein MotB
LECDVHQRFDFDVPGAEVLFDTGKADLKLHFKQILQEFFPRYVGIIASPKYQGSIQEIRIEGHNLQ